MNRQQLLWFMCCAGGGLFIALADKYRRELAEAKEAGAPPRDAEEDKWRQYKRPGTLSESLEEKRRREIGPIVAKMSAAEKTAGKPQQPLSFCKGKVLLRMQDITKSGCEAVVNAARRDCGHGKGLCGAIFDAAGQSMDDACDALPVLRTGDKMYGNVRCETGGAVHTDAFDMQKNYGTQKVIHAVGPNHNETGDAVGGYMYLLLTYAYLNALLVAKALHVRTVALPIISCELFKCPPAVCCAVAAEAARDHCGSFDRIEICVINPDLHQTASQALRVLLGAPEERSWMSRLGWN